MLSMKRQKVSGLSKNHFFCFDVAYYINLFPCVILTVDENLFYKGVDKNTVHGARLHQSHSMGEPLDIDMLQISKETEVPVNPVVTGGGSDDDGGVVQPKQEDQSQPPYPFDTGATLLALTEKHNVRRPLTTLDT